jgi:hypothetical protein
MFFPSTGCSNNAGRAVDTFVANLETLSEKKDDCAPSADIAIPTQTTRTSSAASSPRLRACNLNRDEGFAEPAFLSNELRTILDSDFLTD